MSELVKLFITPNDPLFFRDGRPFDAGGDNTARLLFPPLPSTFYGAIRGTILGQQGTNFSEFKRGNKWDNKFDSIDPKGSCSLKISDWGLATKKGRKIIRYYPIPRDIVKLKGNECLAYRKLTPGKNEFRLNEKIKLKCLENDSLSKITQFAFGEAEGFITEKGLKDYLTKDIIDKKEIINSADLFLPEPRVIIEKNVQSNTSEEHKIATVEFAKLNMEEGTGFVIEINSPLLNTDKNSLRIMRIGGEGKTAYYECIDFTTEFPKPNLNKKFKVILLTPAVFKDGWIPDGINKDSFKGVIGGVNVTLSTAAVGRFTPVGGWDIVKGQAKILRRGVPAGSVYFFEADSEVNSDELLNKLNFKSILGDLSFGKEGLGLSIIGGW